MLDVISFFDVRRMALEEIVSEGPGEGDVSGVAREAASILDAPCGDDENVHDDSSELMNAMDAAVCNQMRCFCVHVC